MSGKSRKKSSFEDRAERLQKVEMKQAREFENYLDEFNEVFDDSDPADAGEHWSARDEEV
ncbi:hypothetical protein [Streptomyces sp. NPDC056883]|uniref:hypothetical protein n=1 Tax=Streptomyces sp. NPDC056883 TaxID=3345959 RepID=UPI0036AA6020